MCLGHTWQHERHAPPCMHWRATTGITVGECHTIISPRLGRLPTRSHRASSSAGLPLVRMPLYRHNRSKVNYWAKINMQQPQPRCLPLRFERFLIHVLASALCNTAFRLTAFRTSLATRSSSVVTTSRALMPRLPAPRDPPPNNAPQQPPTLDNGADGKRIN